MMQPPATGGGQLGQRPCNFLSSVGTVWAGGCAEVRKSLRPVPEGPGIFLTPSKPHTAFQPVKLCILGNNRPFAHAYNLLSGFRLTALRMAALGNEHKNVPVWEERHIMLKTANSRVIRFSSRRHIAEMVEKSPPGIPQCRGNECFLPQNT